MTHGRIFFFFFLKCTHVGSQIVFWQRDWGQTDRFAIGTSRSISRLELGRWRLARPQIGCDRSDNNKIFEKSAWVPTVHEPMTTHVDVFHNSSSKPLLPLHLCPGVTLRREHVIKENETVASPPPPSPPLSTRHSMHWPERRLNVTTN